MFKRLYSVYDMLSQESIGVLMIEANDNAAIRAFKEIISNPRNGPLHTNAGDFVLVLVAQYDTESGRIEQDHPEPFYMANAQRGCIVVTGTEMVRRMAAEQQAQA